jgi:uncharacterized protein (DUF302 family)
LGVLPALEVAAFDFLIQARGMKMRPTKLLIFGNPKGGTPVIQAAPSIAIVHSPMLYH